MPILPKSRKEATLNAVASKLPHTALEGTSGAPPSSAASQPGRRGCVSVGWGFSWFQRGSGVARFARSPSGVAAEDDDGGSDSRGRTCCRSRRRGRAGRPRIAALEDGRGAGCGTIDDDDEEGRFRGRAQGRRTWGCCPEPRCLGELLDAWRHVPCARGTAAGRNAAACRSATARSWSGSAGHGVGGCRRSGPAVTRKQNPGAYLKAEADPGRTPMTSARQGEGVNTSSSRRFCAGTGSAIRSGGAAERETSGVLSNAARRNGRTWSAPSRSRSRRTTTGS